MADLPTQDQMLEKLDDLSRNLVRGSTSMSDSDFRRQQSRYMAFKALRDLYRIRFPDKGYEAGYEAGYDDGVEDGS